MNCHKDDVSEGASSNKRPISGKLGHEMGIVGCQAYQNQNANFKVCPVGDLLEILLFKERYEFFIEGRLERVGVIFVDRTSC